MLPPGANNPWWTFSGPSITTIPATYYWWEGTGQLATFPLGIYNNVLATSATTNTWQSLVNALTGAQIYPTATALYTQACDVPMPSAAHRVRRMSDSPAIIHAGRRAVRRSIDLYLRMRPAEELRRFLTGERLTIQGARLRYHVQKSMSVMRHTMEPGHGIPFRMHVLNPANDQAAASGCVFLSRTPMLDQLLTFIMHVTDPDGEKHLVQTTNWTPRLPPIVERTLGIDVDPDRRRREMIDLAVNRLEEQFARAA